MLPSLSRADVCIHLQSKATVQLAAVGMPRVCGPDYASSRCPATILNAQGTGEVRQKKL